MMDFGLIQKYFKDEMDKVGIIKDEKKTAKSAKGDFQLEFVSISWVINHMTCYKFSALLG